MIADFRDLLAALNDAKAKYLVVGAHALAAHGVPRVTGDLDVWAEPSSENAVRVYGALASFGAQLEMLRIDASDFEASDRVVQIGLPPYRIDIMTSISGVTFSEAWADRMTGHLFEVPVAFLGRASFIKNKRASGRTKDLADIKALGEG